MHNEYQNEHGGIGRKYCEGKITYTIFVYWTPSQEEQYKTRARETLCPCWLEFSAERQIIKQPRTASPDLTREEQPVIVKGIPKGIWLEHNFLPGFDSPCFKREEERLSGPGSICTKPKAKSLLNRCILVYLHQKTVTPIGFQVYN